MWAGAIWADWRKRWYKFKTTLEAWVEFGLGRNKSSTGLREAPRKECPEVRARHLQRVRELKTGKGAGNQINRLFRVGAVVGAVVNILIPFGPSMK